MSAIAMGCAVQPPTSTPRSRKQAPHMSSTSSPVAISRPIGTAIWRTICASILRRGNEGRSMIRHNRLLQRLPKRVTEAAPVAGRRRGMRLRGRALLGLLALLVCGVGLSIWGDPSVVPQAVDLARAIVGPGPVAQVESVVFQAQDSLRQARYQATGASSSVRWAAPAAPPPVARPVVRPTPSVTSTAAPAHAQEREPQDTAPAGPALAWSPFVYTPDVQPVLERALVSPDPTRPYVETALVRIDLRLARLHLVAGTQEPVSKVHTPRPGIISPA